MGFGPREVLMRPQASRLVAITAIFILAAVLPSVASSNTTDTEPKANTVRWSHIRVVRLSFAEGKVTLRRPDSAEWTDAMLNTPIEEGFSLATDKKSFVEVEFENGSTIQLGEMTTVHFTQLALTGEGGHINHLSLDQGYLTFHVVSERYDEYLLTASGVTIEPRGRSVFRTDANQNALRLEVFDGHVIASDSTQMETLGKNHGLVHDSTSGASFQTLNKIEKDEWDKWAEARQQQSILANNDEAVGPDAPIYGWGDLDVYGEWSYFPGYGNGWAPYESTGWSPYSAGTWDWYPGMGYTWISAEPWGWVPFHYGFWNFSPGMGWFWMPGSMAGWSPALVNWYSGPGWVGWTPIGAGGTGGRAPCGLAVSGCLTAMPPGNFGNHQLLNPNSPYVLHPTSVNGVSAIAPPTVQFGQPTGGPRQIFTGFENRPGVQTNTGATRTPAGTGPSSFTRGAAQAPSSLLMGREVSLPSAGGRGSSLANLFIGRRPVRVRMGNTMGGQFPVRSTIGGSGGRGIHGDSNAVIVPGGGPQILSRGSMMTVSAAGGAHGSGGVHGTGRSGAGVTASGSGGGGGGFHSGGSGGHGGGGGHR